MTEDFVSFDLAKKLKEKGYPQEKDWTIAMYDEDENWYSLITTSYYIEYIFEDFDDNDFVCPTISQVLKWLREEKKILVVAAPAFLYREARYFWQCGIYKISLLPNVIPFHKFIDNQESYESAILACIEYVLNNLI